MSAEAALLKANIDADVREIESLYERLENYADAPATELDPQRIVIVITQAQRLQKIYQSDFKEFKAFLDSLN